MRIIRIPRFFYDDHEERTETPLPAIKETKKHVWIDLEHEGVQDLLSDADFYGWTGPDGMGVYGLGLINSARATIKAIKAHATWERKYSGQGWGATSSIDFDTFRIINQEGN